MTNESLIELAKAKLQYKLLLTSKSAVQTLSGSRPELHVFVAGAQRSGTNMMMDALERSFETDVYHETDPRAFDDYLLRPSPVIRELVERSRGRVFTIKALCELDLLPRLMNEFAPAKVIWMVRHYSDMINSAIKSFKPLPGDMAKIATDRNAAGWRGRGMSDATFAKVRELHRPGINAASAVALFWYLRNILFFENGFESDPRVRIVFYEPLVSRPQEEFPRVFEFLGLDYNQRIAASVFANSVRRQPAPDVDEAVRDLCDGLLRRFEAVAAGARKSEHGIRSDG